jgi:hypothetical protein
MQVIFEGRQALLIVNKKKQKNFVGWAGDALPPQP